MLIVRAPMRISFVGGGTDLADFYRLSPGRVISVAIDKYSYVAINYIPLIPRVNVRYSIAETVNHPSELENDRVREALLHLGIYRNIEIGTFSDIPVKSGLGASSSFSVALMKGLYMYQGKKIDKREAAEAASHLEIELVKAPIGKQDQYAAAFGGFNVLQFNPDESVDVLPMRLDFKKRTDFENCLLVFFTGITRFASEVLIEQKKNTPRKIETLKKMADSVFEFKERLVGGDFKGLGNMLHEGWLRKKTLASNVSNSIIDEFYDAGMNAGAWGGKVLGAGGGGCILFLAPEDKKSAIREAVKEIAVRYGLEDFIEIPVRFVQSGVEVVANNHYFGSVK